MKTIDNNINAQFGVALEEKASSLTQGPWGHRAEGIVRITRLN